jgi:hypothetical protein
VILDATKGLDFAEIRRYRAHERWASRIRNAQAFVPNPVGLRSLDMLLNPGGY